MTELRRLHPSRVFLGGHRVRVDHDPKPSEQRRRTGPDRPSWRDETATKRRLWWRTRSRRSSAHPPRRLVVRGDRFADTLAVGPLASAKGWPILLASGEQDLPQVTRDELTKLGVTSVLEAGTRARVDVPNVVRKVGIDRYETCAMIAEYALTQGLESTHTALATGEDFPDGIASAPYLALDNGTLLLTKGLTFTSPVERFLGSNAGDIRTVDAIGIAGIAAQARVVLSRTNDSPPPSPTTTIPPIGTTTTTARPTTTSTSPSATTTTTSAPTTTTGPPRRRLPLRPRCGRSVRRPLRDPRPRPLLSPLHDDHFGTHYCYDRRVAGHRHDNAAPDQRNTRWRAQCPRLWSQGRRDQR